MLNETSGKYFGWIIAYILPGFVALVGLAPIFPSVAEWLYPVSQMDAGAGPAMYALLAAVTIGMIFSCIRWLTIDQLHQLSGVRPPDWDDGELPNALEGFDYLVQNHFRYYEFCSNTLVALILAYGLNRCMGTLPFLGIGTDLGMLALVAVLFAASRDALTKYYRRTGQLLRAVAEKGDTAMYNGNDHAAGGGKAAPARPKAGSPDKPITPAKPQQSQAKDVQSTRQ